MKVMKSLVNHLAQNQGAPPEVRPSRPRSETPRRAVAIAAGVAVAIGAIMAPACFHLLHTRHGLALIRKEGLSIHDSYLDVRQFDSTDWLEHPAAARAVVQADRVDLFATDDSHQIARAVDRVVHGLRR